MRRTADKRAVNREDVGTGSDVLAGQHPTVTYATGEELAVVDERAVLKGIQLHQRVRPVTGQLRQVVADGETVCPER